MPASWWELQLEVPADIGDAIISFLFDAGSTGLETSERPGFTAIKAYFHDDPPLAALERFYLDLRSAGVAIGAPVFHTRPVDEEDWAQSWKRHFRPLAVGRRLFVCPPWEHSQPAGRLPIVIDPGMAFGTGQHATTRGCLELIEEAIASRPIRRALDVGTGSGILAIALCKLGAERVYAIDTDELACQLARANTAANACAEKVTVTSCWNEVEGTFDLIVANLFTNALVELASRLMSLLRPSGNFICSGFWSADEEKIAARYDALQVCRRRSDEGWVALSMERREA